MISANHDKLEGLSPMVKSYKENGYFIVMTYITYCKTYFISKFNKKNPTRLKTLYLRLIIIK